MGATKKWVSKRTLTWRGVIQRENGTSEPASSFSAASSSASRTAVSASVSPSCTAPPGEDPRAAHEPGRRVALYEQELEPVVAVADRDDGARRPGLGHITRVELLAGRGTVYVHGGTLLTFAAA